MQLYKAEVPGPEHDKLSPRIKDTAKVLWEDVLASWKEDEGPQVDLRNELIRHLDHRVTVISDYVVPITTKSERLLFAVKIRPGQVKAVAAGVKKMLETDPTIKGRKFEGLDIWETVEQQQIPMPNAPVIDFTAELTRICGVDLTRVVGLNLLSVLILISEIGVDMSPWRNAKAFGSWLGLCPGNKISGGKVLSSRTARVSNRAATLLRTLATAVGRSDTWLGSFHRRMKSRLGPAAANTATAHKLACLIYHLLKYREPYIEVDRLLYEARIQRCRLAKLKKLATELGYELVENQQAA